MLYPNRIEHLRPDYHLTVYDNESHFVHNFVHKIDFHTQTRTQKLRK